MTELARGPVIALQADGIEIPPGILDLERFRTWARSDSFPERGRIDWVAGRLEVDMSPEDLNTHGSPKSAIAGQLVFLIQESGRGMVFIDRARFSNPGADLSVEPDVLVLLFETVEAGRARLIPKASGEEGPNLPRGTEPVEIEGTVDLAVECVSDTSAVKDRRRLREAYHSAGVREYWLVDVRGGKIDFQVLVRNESGYAAVAPDAEGFSRSEVLGRDVRLSPHRKAAELVSFRLEVR